MNSFALYLLFGSLFALWAGLRAAFDEEYRGSEGGDPSESVSLYLISILFWGPVILYFVWDTLRFRQELRRPYEKILGSKIV